MITRSDHPSFFHTFLSWLYLCDRIYFFSGFVWCFSFFLYVCVVLCVLFWGSCKGCHPPFPSSPPSPWGRHVRSLTTNSCACPFSPSISCDVSSSSVYPKHIRQCSSVVAFSPPPPPHHYLNPFCTTLLCSNLRTWAKIAGMWILEPSLQTWHQNSSLL